MASPWGLRSDGETQGSWRRVAGLEAPRGRERTRPTLPTRPGGDTKNSSGTPPPAAVHPAGRRPPTPAPRATKEVTLGGGGGRGAAPGRPLPQRLDARQIGEATAAEPPPPRSQAPSPGRWGPSRAAPAFLGETGAARAHPRAETEHPRGAEAAGEVERPRRHRDEHRATLGHAPSHTPDRPLARSPTPDLPGSGLETTGSGFSGVWTRTFAAQVVT